MLFFMDNTIFWYKTTILFSLSSWLEGRGWEVYNMLLRAGSVIKIGIMSNRHFDNSK